MSELIDRYADRIQQALAEFLPVCDGENDEVNRMMWYSLENGGKRIRPVLTLEFCRVCGGDPERALPFACAVEYLHTYSLIHDDLPCMDNADMRRGKPSSHVRYGEANALLAGDGLLTRAFGILATAELPPARIVRAVDVLADCAGTAGMIGGQYLDLAGEERTLTARELFELDALKTGALIRCACVLGCIAADADWQLIEAAERYADELGIAFQITDDILDVTADSEQLGKSAGTDEKNGKSTYVSLLGIEGARAAVRDYTQRSVDALSIFGEEGEALSSFARRLAERSY